MFANRDIVQKSRIHRCGTGSSPHIEAGLYMRRPKRAHDSSDAPRGSLPAVRDALFGGKIVFWQPKEGYRVNVDSLLLARFAAVSRPNARHLVDLGAGAGAVTLAYAQWATFRTCTLVEQEPELGALAIRNLHEASLPGAALALDVTGELPSALRGVADVVVSNPPFFANGTRDPDNGLRTRARSGPIEPFLRAAAAVMGRRAHAFFAYPAPALPEFVASAARAGLVPKRMRLVHAFATTPARLVLLELKRAKPGALVIEPAIVEWSSPGSRSPELAAIVAGLKSCR
ncbi:MAG TPA: methyltransferase [Polyangiaceae bacterium]